LWQVGDVALWARAAAWIGRFHAGFTPARAQRLASRVRVLIHDEEFYWTWLYRAVRFTAAHTARRRLLEDIGRGYGAIVARLLALPRTLIHGEFYASNVLVSFDTAAVRVCPVDWEMAALGPGLIDLAALVTGWAGAERETIEGAYLAAAPALGAAYGEGTRHCFAADLDCCRLYLAVRMLGWSDDWEPPREHARDWLAEAAGAWERLRD
jgi:aminoglycoside phosphotransferase (APT) family kinase protein